MIWKDILDALKQGFQASHIFENIKIQEPLNPYIPKISFSKCIQYPF